MNLSKAVEFAMDGKRVVVGNCELRITDEEHPKVFLFVDGGNPPHETRLPLKGYSIDERA